MNFDLIEIIIIISFFQLLVFAAFLFTQRPYKISNIILGIFLFSEAIGELNSFYFGRFIFFYEKFPHLFFIGIPFSFLWAPAIYLFVRSIVSDKYKINHRHILHLIPFVITFLYMFVVFHQQSAETKRILLRSSSLYFYINIFQYASIFQILIYNINTLLILRSYRKQLKNSLSSISKVNLSWLNYVIIGYSISYLVSASFQIAGNVFGYYNYVMTAILFLTFFIFFNIIFFKAWRQPEIFSVIEEDIKYKASKLTKEEADDWIKKLNDYVIKHKPYLNSELTINQLAEKISISPRVLSQVLNEYLHQNFYDYINSLRIEESKRMLLDYSNKKTVLEILYDVGYNTKSAYNIAFKNATGFTPSEYRKKFSKESISSE